MKKDKIKGILKVAYKPMYATSHQVGSLKQNWQAVKNWLKGQSPAMVASFAQSAGNDELKHDMSSISAPTLVDRIHGFVDGVVGKGNPYGTEDMGKEITPEQFDQFIQQHRMGGNLGDGSSLRAPRTGEYDGSWEQQEDGGFRKGNTVSYPIDLSGISKQSSVRREGLAKVAQSVTGYVDPSYGMAVSSVSDNIGLKDKLLKPIRWMNGMERRITRSPLLRKIRSAGRGEIDRIWKGFEQKSSGVDKANSTYGQQQLYSSAPDRRPQWLQKIFPRPKMLGEDARVLASSSSAGGKPADRTTN